MKASLIFRDEQKPIFRAKVPLSILGLPFQSGVVAGESKKLTLNLGTFFDAGPAVRVSYRPNDSWNPFSLVLKSGTGPFGSPIASSMSMSAEFNLLNRGNPTFMLHFKPNFGDFSVRKSQSSVTKATKAPIETDASIEVVEAPPRVNDGGDTLDNGSFFAKKISAALTPESPVGIFSNALSGMEVSARTVLPVKGRALMTFRWGVRVPGEFGGDFNPSDGFRLQKVPFLVMNKVGIEHVPIKIESKDPSKGIDQKVDRDVDGAEACFSVRRQLESLQAENGHLRQAIDDLRREFTARRSNQNQPPLYGFDSSKYRDVDRNGNRASSGKTDRRNNDKKSADSGGAFSAKSVEMEASEELKKALKGAAIA